MSEEDMDVGEWIQILLERIRELEKRVAKLEECE